MSVLCKSAALAAAVVAGVGMSASAATMTFQNGTAGYTGTQDAGLQNYYSVVDVNEGISTVLQLGNHSTSNTSVAIIKFDGLGVLAGQYSSIDSVQLILRQHGGGTSDPGGDLHSHVSIYQMKDGDAAWIQGAADDAVDPNGGATWNHLAYYAPPNGNTSVQWLGGAAGITAGTDYDSSAMSTVYVNGADNSTYYSWDVSPTLVNQWITGGPNAGLFIQDDDSATRYWGFFSSDFDPNISNTAQPELVVNYTPVPEPLTGSLLLLGGGILAMRRRRR